MKGIKTFCNVYSTNQKIACCTNYKVNGSEIP